MKVDVSKRQSNSREELFTFYLHTDSLHRPTRRSHRRSPHSNNAGLVQHSWDSNDYRKDTKRWHDYRTGTGSRKGGSHDANGGGRANTGNGCGHTDYKSKTMWESHADSESIAKPYTCSNGQARDESFTSSNWWGKSDYNHYTKFRSCDDSFRRLQLFWLYLLPCNQLRVANCTVVTSRMHRYVVWIQWQQGRSFLSIGEL